jgi:hypothetical protein
MFPSSSPSLPSPTRPRRSISATPKSSKPLKNIEETNVGFFNARLDYFYALNAFYEMLKLVKLINDEKENKKAVIEEVVEIIKRNKER